MSTTSNTEASTKVNRQPYERSYQIVRSSAKDERQAVGCVVVFWSRVSLVVDVNSTLRGAGPRCRSGEEPGPHGLHLRGLPAVPHPGVLGGVEHGEPGGDLPRCHRRVSYNQK